MGILLRSGEILVLATEGVLNGNSCNRVSPADRWKTSAHDQLKGLPWSMRPVEEEVTSASAHCIAGCLGECAISKGC